MERSNSRASDGSSRAASKALVIYRSWMTEVAALSEIVLQFRAAVRQNDLAVQNHGIAGEACRFLGCHFQQRTRLVARSAPHDDADRQIPIFFLLANKNRNN